MSTYHIFLVDSDRSHAQKIKSHLKNYSEYIIDVFTDLVECRKKMRLLKPAVVFLDEELKHDEKVVQKDIEFMKELKEISPNTEVVLFTGEERIHLMPESIKNGAHDFILKSEQSHIHAETAILTAIRNYKKNAEAKFEKGMGVAVIVVMVLLVVFAVVGHHLGIAA